MPPRACPRTTGATCGSSSPSSSTSTARRCGCACARATDAMARAFAVLLPIAIGYLCGSLPWGLWLGRALRGGDVRTLGSGNLGATNVYRSLGPGIGIATLALDLAKGALPVWLLPGSALGAHFPGGAEWCRITVGLAAIAGHLWPLFARVLGGKGVAATTRGRGGRHEGRDPRGRLVGHDPRRRARPRRPRGPDLGQRARRPGPARGRPGEPEVFAWHQAPPWR